MTQLCQHGCGHLATHTTKGSLSSGPFKGKPVRQCSKSANSCPAVIANINNLRIMWHTANKSKHIRSDITPDQLMGYN